MVACEQAVPPKRNIGQRQKSCSERGGERKGKGERKGLAYFSFRPYSTWERACSQAKIWQNKDCLTVN